MAISVWKKFILLLWKNYRLQWAHKLQLVIELLMPALFSVLLVVVRTLVDPSLEPVRYFKPVQIDNLDLFKHGFVYKRFSIQNSRRMHALLSLLLKPKSDSMAQNNAGLPEYSLFYSPQNDVLDGIVGEAAKSLGLTHSGFLDAASLESAVTASNAFAGIEFEPSWSDLSKLPDKFTYTLRFPSELRTALNKIFSVTWFTMYLFPFGQDVAMGPRNAEHDDGGIPAGYIREGFVPIQNALSLSYIRHKSGTNDEFPEIVMQRYPYAAFTLDFLIMGLGNLVPLIIMLSFIYPCTCITRYVTTEKEKQLKEVMKIMGLSNWLHWSAWFIKSFITMGISSAIIAALMVIKWHKGVAVLNYGSYAALLLFLLIYCVVSICFCFMISPFFTKASTAAAVTGILWFITFLPYSFTLGNYTQLTLTEKLLSCLISNTAMAYGIRLIIQFESSGEGFHLSSLFQPVNVDDELTVGAIMIMMLISAAAYLLICLYIEQIFPGDFGVPRKWYFPFTREFWCGQRNNYSAVEDSRSPNENNARDKNTFEAEPEGKPIGIQLKNLKKKFGKKMAVNGISMNMFEDEITVLLGHNGAGKTTTISMLTGMFPPTSGTATINGNDIRTNLEAARTSLGICPQHNVLFDDMSVGNHIRFFSRLKGLKGDAVEKEVQKYLRLIQLENKEKAFAGTLSGGMKRKLALCCALCGDTKVVLCDEPSSGMDPAARRQLWDLLQQEKIGRTLLLTTHFMDEADVLGDRIAIMCDGELKCYGSSFFLKKHYGSGYSLICVKEDRCIPADVTALLGLYIPGIQPKSDIGAELTYNLPDKYSDRFEKMFGALEERSKDLHLSGYGVGITSMEEVFMKVGAETDAEGKRKDEAAIMKGASGYADDDNESMRSNRAFSGERQSMRGVNLTLNQWRAMMLKKVIYTWRNKFIFAVQNLLCVIFICLTIMIARNQSTFQVLPKMTFSRTQYPSSVTVLSRSDKLSPTSDMGKIADYYESIAKSLGGEHTYEGTGDKNFTDYILDIAEHDQPTVNSRYLVGASMEDDKITAWLNNKPLHTAPLTVNAVHNAMAKKYINEDAEISVSIWPYPYSTQTILRQLKIGNNVGSQMASNLCFAMCFVTSMYLIFLIKERASRAKLLQFVSGVRVWTFWTSAYLWDVATFTFTCLIICLTLRCFDEVGFMSFAELGRYFLVLWIFGLAVLPMTYVCSFMFSDAATGFARLSIFNIFSGVALFFLIMIMAFETFELQSQSKTMAAVFRVLPHFSLSMGLNNVYMFAATERACERVNAIPPVLVCELIPSCCNPPPAFGMETPGVLREIIYLVSMAVISFVLLILGELGYGNELLYLIRKHIFKGPAQPEAGYFEEDVQRERERIINMKPEELEAKNLVLDRVSKYYGPFLAVNQVSLCVGPVECFGLLGVNGAGKTTTFKMMTGDERISSGSAYVQGLNMKTDMNRIYKRIGYCPQFDALLDDLTGREMLRIFCLLRGVRLETIKPISEELARSFGFMKHIDKRTKTYSGGNKRKLSTAIASLGAPSVIYLDEPTTGMDPAARRQLWNVVCRIRDAGKSIVLTSHSMEECEALCTRVAIMVNGEFKCIGSTQHLKNKFSKGLVLKIKVGRPDKEGHGPRASMMSSGSRYRTQDSDDSVPSTPLPYENTSAVSLRRSLDSIKVPRSNGHLTDEQIINQTNDRDAIPSGTRSTVTYRRQSNELVAPVGRRKTAENMQTVKDFVTQKFPDAILQEEYQGMLTYYIPLSGIKWSKIFGVMERNRYDLNVEDYSISQTTLEEIFLDFAKHQREDPRTSHAKKKKKIEVIKKPEDNEKKKKLFERSHREP